MGRSPTEISLRSDLAASRQIMVCGSKVRKETPASASQEERRSKQRVNNESFVSSPAVAIIFERSGRKKYRNGNYGRSGRCRSHSVSRKKRGSRELCARPFPPSSSNEQRKLSAHPIQCSVYIHSYAAPADQISDLQSNEGSLSCNTIIESQLQTGASHDTETQEEFPPAPHSRETTGGR